MPPRAAVLANGRLHLAFDDRARLREAAWPGAGGPNHLLGGLSRIGVAAGGRFAWLDGTWRGEAGYAPGRAAARARFRHPRLRIGLTIDDALHPAADLLLRRFVIANETSRARDVSLFLQTAFRIDGTDVGNTVALDPATGGLAHWRGTTWILTNAEGASSHAAGASGFGGHEGTWRDAEDGELSGNPMAHGAVDGVLAASRRVQAGGRATVRAWLAFGRDLAAVRDLDRLARGRTPPPSALPAPPRAVSPRYREAWRRSVYVLRAACDHRGGILAAVDSDILSFNRDTYAYVWPRDGAFVARSLDLAGEHALARRYFEFVARLPRVEEVDDRFRGGLLHKYTADGALASTWHPWRAPPAGDLPPAPIQEDETALTLWALAEHARLARADVGPLLRPLVRPLADFLVAYRDETGLPLPSHDLWEERWGILLFTCATVVAGLRAASRLTGLPRYARVADEVAARTLDALTLPDGTLARRRAPDGTLDSTPDASMLVAARFGLLPARDTRFVATVRRVARGTRVAGRIGGHARYAGDSYHRTDADAPGNPWVVTTLWTAAARESCGELGALDAALRWTLDRAGPGLHLAEQFHPRTGAALSVEPLTWSHAAVIEALAH